LIVVVPALFTDIGFIVRRVAGDGLLRLSAVPQHI